MSGSGGEAASVGDAAVALLRRLADAMGTDGEHRVGQEEMCRAAAEAMAGDRALVVQAGTGTGKSLAYLAAAKAVGRPVVVATATKALQDQLDRKELPFVANHAGGMTWAVLKGRANYLCRQRLDEVDHSSGQLGLAGTERLAAADLDPIKEWAETTPTGDRAELDHEPRPAVWAALSVGPDECPGAARCPRGEDCFAEAARRRAAGADVVVVNLHLYGAHLAADRAVLPPHDVLVVDEAHEFADIVSRAVGVALSPGRLGHAARTLASLVEDGETVEGLRTAGERLAAALRAADEGRIRRQLPAAVTAALDAARTRLDRAATAVRAIESDAADVSTRKARVQNVLGGLQVDIARLVEMPRDTVTWIEHGTGDPRIEQAPLDVGRELEARLWDVEATGLEIVAAGPDAPDEAVGRPPAAVVMTSATIPRNLAATLHLDPARTTELDVGSPFDFEHQALLYCAAHLPDPRASTYADALVEELVTLIDAAGGRTLALFTSLRMMRDAADAVAERVEYQVLVQGTMPKEALVAEFTGDETSCLFATMGYWQGIDVPGPSLSMVTIDRIPFPRPDDPLLEARREAARGAAFETIDLTRAATLLAQGAGRLIRTRTDRGVVAVLDPRLATAKRYRWDLVAALPPMPRTRDLADVKAFFAAAQ